MIVKMLTHLHVIVEHLRCWHICKGDEKRQSRAQGAARGGIGQESGSPPPLGRWPAGLGLELCIVGTVTALTGVHH
jgi:hypothetical protein